MLRLRFHGRGGQGMKTASRVVGTAAALAGWQAQDSPIYGAERRGAPMAAYVRIDRAPIFERGAIARPDLVVVADETLLDAPGVQPLTGLAASGTLVVATSHSEEEVRAHTGHGGRVVARDFLALALDRIGTPAGVSTALASVCCALLGLPEHPTEEALEAELAAAGVAGDRLDRSLALASDVRVGVEPIGDETVGRRAGGALAAAARAVIEPTERPSGDAVPGTAVVDVTPASAWIGTPSVAATANTRSRGTGSWRVFRPVIALDRCTRCWVCFVWCPDGAIALETDDTPRVDYSVCKGCLVCAEVCPTGAITTMREVHPWNGLEHGA